MSYNSSNSPPPGLPVPTMSTAAQQLQYQYQRIQEADQERHHFIQVSSRAHMSAHVAKTTDFDGSCHDPHERKR
jgi:hypothetical protein